jgi:hypothetical protein
MIPVGLADVVMPEAIVQISICGDSAGVAVHGFVCCKMLLPCTLAPHGTVLVMLVLLIRMPVLSL